MKIFAVTISLILSLITSGSIDIYPEAAKVTNIDYNTDTVTVECFNGNQFCFVGAEDYMVNDVVTMLMYGHDTPLVEDDDIIMVRYSGFWIE